MDYLLLKWMHIVSSTLLFGTGLGSAFYKFMADRGGNIESIVQTNRNVVLADWLFTTPTAILQPVTGVGLALHAGYPLSSGWLVAALALYAIAGVCWLVVVVLQIRMRDISLRVMAAGGPLAENYWHLARAWFWLGIPAFSAMVLIFYLMVVKPPLWG